ncbi:MAG TPA: 2Fe-2S iron-sulfur cluster-binding protein [Alphaproteobacteria bacterium]|nr:2Fe-2S iron-sulfur cluster-binding protein [Alphaproteobacteria bacterium]
MPKVTYIEANGAKHDVTVDSGTNCRDAAVDNDIPGIDGDCGGVCACATCHVYVDPAWLGKTGKAVPGEMEAELLQFAEDFRENSRLACQIKITSDLDGLVLRVPSSQH